MNKCPPDVSLEATPVLAGRAAVECRVSGTAVWSLIDWRARTGTECGTLAHCCYLQSSTHS